MQTRAIVLVYKGSEIQSDDKYRLIQCLANANIITDGSVTTYTLSEEDLIKASVKEVLDNKLNTSMSEKEILQKAANFIMTKYPKSVQSSGAHLIVQIISDIHNNNSDAEMLKQSIIALSEYPDEAFIISNKIMPKNVLTTIKLIYTNHLVQSCVKLIEKNETCTRVRKQKKLHIKDKNTNIVNMSEIKIYKRLNDGNRGSLLTTIKYPTKDAADLAKQSLIHLCKNQYRFKKEWSMKNVIIVG